MADRKARTITVKLSITATNIDLKKATDKESELANPTVIQDLGAGQFLVEFETKEQAEVFIDSGLDFDHIYVDCRPPHGYYINVSILGLRAYISDKAVLEALGEFGELKSEVIRLKYKNDHDLAGMENGNRFVKMVLTKPSIPYSLRIDGECCCVIHTDQQRVCSNCHALGHSRRKCPEITCRICEQKGHLSYDCTEKYEVPRMQPENENLPTNTEENEDISTSTDPPSNTDPGMNEETSDNTTATETPLEEAAMDVQAITFDFLRPGIKRQLPSDSDSDNTKSKPQRRPKIRPTPNLAAAGNRKENKGTQDNSRKQ